MNKYSAGRSAYWIYNSKGKSYVYDGMLVVARVSKDELGYHYSLENSDEDIIDWCREEDMFCTNKDAQEECLKRNGR